MSPTKGLAALALVLGCTLAPPGAALTPGNLELCAQWRSARGAEKASLANRLGASNGLTKNTKLAEAQPSDINSLYRIADIQRLCRNS